MNNLMLSYRLWKMRRRVRPSREFRRALWAELEPKLPRRSFLQALAWQRLAVPVGILLLSLGATTAYAYTSPSVAWGNPLFQIKGRGENIEDRLATTPESSARLRLKKMQRRMAEAEKIAETKPEVAEELIDAARGEFIRGLDQAAKISDVKLRKEVLSKFIKGDPEQLVRIQNIAEKNPARFRDITERLLEAEQRRLADKLIQVKDEEIRILLERQMIKREAMLDSLYLDDFSAQESELGE